MLSPGSRIPQGSVHPPHLSTQNLLHISRGVLCSGGGVPELRNRSDTGQDDSAGRAEAMVVMVALKVNPESKGASRQKRSRNRVSKWKGQCVQRRWEGTRRGTRPLQVGRQWSLQRSPLESALMKTHFWVLNRHINSSVQRAGHPWPCETLHVFP